MGCKRLNTDFFTFLEIVHSKKSASEEKKRINYYPFGLQHKGYNNMTSSNGNSTAQKFKFGGKELNEELGLDWYDFGARNYDASLGRWMNIDPMGELLMSHSPFNYAFNNPVYFDDPTGMLPGLSPSQLYNLIEDINFLVDMSQSNFKLDEVVVSANTSSSNNNNNDKLLHIWGIGTGLQGNGQTGSGVSIDYDDLTPSGGGANTTNAFARFLRWAVDLLSTSKNMNEVSEKIAPTKKPNESTMDNKVEEEAKNITEEIYDVTTYSTYGIVVDPSGFFEELKVGDTIINVSRIGYRIGVVGKEKADSLSRNMGPNNMGYPKRVRYVIDSSRVVKSN